jgi:hypothetical protein
VVFPVSSDITAMHGKLDKDMRRGHRTLLSVNATTLRQELQINLIVQRNHKLLSVNY